MGIQTFTRATLQPETGTPRRVPGRQDAGESHHFKGVQSSARASLRRGPGDPAVGGHCLPASPGGRGPKWLGLGSLGSPSPTVWLCSLRLGWEWLPLQEASWEVIPLGSFEAGAKVQVRLRWAGWLMGDKGSPRWGQRPSVGHQPPGWSLLQPGAWLVAKVSLRACSRPGQRTPFSLPVALGCLCSPPRVPVTFWALRRPVWGVVGGNDMMGHTHTHTHILSRGQVRRSAPPIGQFWLSPRAPPPTPARSPTSGTRPGGVPPGKSALWEPEASGRLRWAL